MEAQSVGEKRSSRRRELRAGLRKARNAREGKRRNERIANIQGKLADAQEDQKFFDFGLRPIVNEDEDPVQLRERGRFVQRGGEVAFEQGGGKLRVPVERDERGVPQEPNASDVR